MRTYVCLCAHVYVSSNGYTSEMFPDVLNSFKHAFVLVLQRAVADVFGF